MGPRKSSFRSRATSLIKSPLATIHQGQFHDPTRARNNSNASQQQALNEKQGASDELTNSSAGGQTHATSDRDEEIRERDARRVVRTIPSWVRTQKDLENGLIPTSPPYDPPGAAYIAQHNSHPATKPNGSASYPSRQDQAYAGQEYWSDRANPQRVSRWKAFADASAYPHFTPNGGRIVSEEWLRENGPDYDQPWMAGVEEGDPKVGYKSRIRRRAWYLRLERTTLRSPIVPMVIRMIVLSFSVVALGLATSIHHLANQKDSVLEQVPSTNMAIIVDAVAIVYLSYIAYDEYSGKPLGLRSARAKMRLIFLDLFFIVFDSANLSLAFESIRDTICEDPNEKPCDAKQKRLFDMVLHRQRALSSVLLIALVAWLLTFSISITRLVEKMTSR